MLALLIGLWVEWIWTLACVLAEQLGYKHARAVHQRWGLACVIAVFVMTGQPFWGFLILLPMSHRFSEDKVLSPPFWVNTWMRWMMLLPLICVDFSWKIELGLLCLVLPIGITQMHEANFRRRHPFGLYVFGLRAWSRHPEALLECMAVLWLWIEVFAWSGIEMVGLFGLLMWFYRIVPLEAVRMQRYGYQTYAQRVPCWIPRLFPRLNVVRI